MAPLSALPLNPEPVWVRRLGVIDYRQAFDAMRRFTEQRRSDTPDEVWLLEHPPVFTQGMNGKPEHLLAPGDTPVLQVDRGGQVTYHAPGQLVAYLLLDIRRRKLGVRQVVSAMEQAVVALLASYGIASEARQDAPGVYIDGAKVASLGLRVRRGCTYHGLSLNVDMDLAPFSRINPCGYQGLRVTQLRDHGVTDSLEQVSERLLTELGETLGMAELVSGTGHLPT